MKLLDEVALLELDNGKANAIDLAFLDELERSVGAAEAQACALVITGYDRFFSAGLALPALVDLDRPAIHSFIARFSEVMLRLYASPLPVVAAVNGHAIAGGCVLALMADVRLMVDEGAKIGLNEVQLGIGLPASVIEPLRGAVPAASLVPIALEGRLLSPAEARGLGLVDDLSPRAELEARALARARAMAAQPQAGVAQVKAALRRPILERIARVDAAETERWVETWCSDGARARIGAVVAKLRGAG